MSRRRAPCAPCRDEECPPPSVSSFSSIRRIRTYRSCARVYSEAHHPRLSDRRRMTYNRIDRSTTQRSLLLASSVQHALSRFLARAAITGATLISRWLIGVTHPRRGFRFSPRWGVTCGRFRTQLRLVGLNQTPSGTFFREHGTRSVAFFAGHGYVTTQDGTSRPESRGLRRLEIGRSAHGHCSAPSHPCRALG